MTNEGKEKPRFYTCDCFTTDNIFLEEYKLHVRFVSEQQFRLDYQAVSGYQFATFLYEKYKYDEKW